MGTSGYVISKKGDSQTFKAGELQEDFREAKKKTFKAGSLADFDDDKEEAFKTEGSTAVTGTTIAQTGVSKTSVRGGKQVFKSGELETFEDTEAEGVSNVNRQLF